MGLVNLSQKWIGCACPKSDQKERNEINNERFYAVV